MTCNGNKNDQISSARLTSSQLRLSDSQVDVKSSQFIQSAIHVKLPFTPAIGVLSVSALEGLSYSDKPGSYAGDSLTTDRVSHAGQTIARKIHLQWTPSHLDLEGNDIADTLAKADTCEVPEPSATLPHLIGEFL
ncbi:hypothetical protein TNCV_2907261 [Trichonephila clavipes]|nr:hypothetical protein TNCV_2907261 [Trichonephila clavipes]